MSKKLDMALERLAGIPIHELRDVPLSVRRAGVEEQTGMTTIFPSLYPDIGRGSVMRDRVISHEKILSCFDVAFHK